MDGSAEAQLGPIEIQAPGGDDEQVLSKSLEGLGDKADPLEITTLSEEGAVEALQIINERHARTNLKQMGINALMCREPRRKPKDQVEPLWQRLAKRYLPILTWAPLTTLSSLRADAIAGLTVGVMVIPQSMSYANIAGLDYIYGMYSACVPTFVYGLFGQSRQLAVGPVAMVSLLVEAGLGDQVPCEAGDPSKFCQDEYVKYAVVTSLCVGVFQILASVLKLGFLVSFLGHPVTSGFTSGAAIIIGLSQVKYIFGFDVPKSQYIYETIGNIAERITKTNGMSLALGLLWIAFLMANKKIAAKYKRRLGFLGPMGPLVSCVVGILLLWLCKPLSEDLDVKYVGKIPDGIFPVSVMDWDFAKVGKVLPTALTACLIGYMESIAIGKNLAAKNGYEIEPGQELLALGVANLVGACFSCYPVTGSFSRSAVNNMTGARTQLSGLITSAVMLLTLLFLTPLFYYLPKFALAAIVINSVIPLVAYQEAMRLFRIQKRDFVLWVFAFLGTLFLGILLGISLAVLLSLMIVIYESVRPQIVILWRIPGTRIYRNMKQETSGAFVPNIFIARIGSSLYFANASYVKEMLLNYVSDLEEVNPTEFLILEMTPVISIDSTAVHMLHDIVTDFRARGVMVAFAMVGNRVDRALRTAGLKSEIGEQWFFATVDEAVQHCLRRQHALRKLRGLKDTLSGSGQIRIEEELEAGMMKGHDVKIGNELGFSNELHHACTTLFVNVTRDCPSFLGEAAAALKRCNVRVVRASIEPHGEGSKHSYLVKSGKSDGKLSAREMDRLREDLEQVMERLLLLGPGAGNDADAREPLGEHEGSNQTARIGSLEEALEQERAANQQIKDELQDQGRKLDLLLARADVQAAPGQARLDP